MSKTRRQRALEYPGRPKPGVRDPNRKAKSPAAVEMGRLGGEAPHKTRGLQTLTAEQRHEIGKRAAKTRKLNKELLKQEVS